MLEAGGCPAGGRPAGRCPVCGPVEPDEEGVDDVDDGDDAALAIAPPPTAAAPIAAPVTSADLSLPMSLLWVV
jgi:hypothetical protein